MGWLQTEFRVSQGTGFAFQQDRDAVVYRVGQSCTAGDQLLLFAVVFQGALCDGANDEFKKSCVHGAMIALRPER